MKYLTPFLSFLIIVSLISCSEQASKDTAENTSNDETLTSYTLEFATPEEMGMSSDSLAKIDEMVMGYVDKNIFPGAVILIAKEGKIIYETEVGWSDSSHTDPYQKDDIFRMASMTKPFTSVAAMQLIESGKLSLEDPVSKYIPEFADAQVMTSFNEADSTWESRPANRQPTVKNLLNHTAGVPYAFMSPGVNGAILATKGIPDLTTYQDVTLEEKMAELGTLPLMHDPGEQWMYGLNTDVLGRVVEVASGMNLEDYIRENITKPLGINDTRFFFEEDYKDRLVHVYQSNPDSTIKPLIQYPGVDWYHSDYPFYGGKSYYSGGSGLSGTARDYFVFSQTMLNDGTYGEAQILKPETAQLMHTSSIDTLTYPWGPAKFGLGFDIADGHPVRPDGTYSWGGAFSTVFWIDPENDVVAIMLSQVLFGVDRSMSSKFEQIVYSSILKEELVAVE